MTEEPEMVSVTSIATIVADVHLAAQLDQESPLVSLADLEGLGELREPRRRVADARGRVGRVTHFRPGDLLVSAIPREQPMVWRADAEGFCASSLTVLRPGDDFDSSFLLWSLRALCLARPGRHLNLRRVRVRAPGARATVSAGVLDRLEAVIRLRRRALADLGALRPAIYRQRLGDPLQQDSGWSTIPLKELISEIEAGWSPKCMDRPTNGEEWGVIRVSAVSSGRFLPAQNKALPPEVEPRRELALKAGDLLMVRSNTPALVGVAAIVAEDHPQLLLSDKVWRLRLADGLEPRFVKAMLSYPTVRERLARIATGNIASMVNLTQAKVRELALAVPRAAHQEEHLGDLAILDRLDDLQSRQIGLLDDLLRAVLTRAFLADEGDALEQIAIERALFGELSPLQRSVWRVLASADGALTVPELSRRLERHTGEQHGLDRLRQALELLTAAGAATRSEDARSRRWSEALPHDLAAAS